MKIEIMSKDQLSKLFDDQGRYDDYISKKYKYLDLGWNGIGTDNLVVALDNEKIAGILQIGKAPQQKNLYWMKFVTVHPDYRNQGIAKSLIREMFNYLSKIPEAEVELSTYEKEGEVLVETVSSLAKEYDMPIRHRRISEPYQDAKRPYLRIGDKVQVDDPVSGYKGSGILAWFIEYENPVKAFSKRSEDQDPIIVELKYITI